MKFNLAFTYLLLLALEAIAVGCGGQIDKPKATSQVWRSTHHAIEASLVDGWQVAPHVSSPGDTFDRPDRLLVSFVNKRGPLGYILRVENDVSTEQVSTEDYYAAVRAQITEQPGSELLDEAEVVFHERPFHRFRARVVGKKGAMGAWYHVSRHEGRFIIIQWVFPINEGGAIEAPKEIVAFDEGVRITDPTMVP